jgi:hypothetical protein
MARRIRQLRAFIALTADFRIDWHCIRLGAKGSHVPLVQSIGTPYPLNDI